MDNLHTPTTELSMDKGCYGIAPLINPSFPSMVRYFTISTDDGPNLINSPPLGHLIEADHP